jgi:DNA-binding transcriptional MerR regulator
MNNVLGLGSVARRLNVARHRIVYAVESGFVPEPARLEGRRAFSEKDIEPTGLF